MTPLKLRLPATSANLGPGFDALGLAMDLWLDVEARAAERFTIAASGRDADRVGVLESNLMLSTYRDLAPGAPPLALKVHNGIPLGMGCGSSAAALLAGVLLANHFGALGLGSTQVVSEASRREGHPDNIAACFYGGMTVSATVEGEVVAASCGADLDWRILLAVPGEGLATSRARAMLPDHYSRADAVANVQATALLVSAFALNRPQLLRAACRDRMHQPYRLSACPLLARLLPILGSASAAEAIFAVSLSGAGPSVLLLADPMAPLAEVRRIVQAALAGYPAELLELRIASGAQILPPPVT